MRLFIKKFLLRLAQSIRRHRCLGSRSKNLFALPPSAIASLLSGDITLQYCIIYCVVRRISPGLGFNEERRAWGPTTGPFGYGSELRAGTQRDVGVPVARVSLGGYPSSLSRAKDARLRVPNFSLARYERRARVS